VNPQAADGRTIQQQPVPTTDESNTLFNVA
jgi:hypothetical protein